MMHAPQKTAFWEPDLARQEEAATREASFAELVNRQSQFVFRVAYVILRNAADCEDVVQDTFLKIYRANAWEGIRDERAFLARTAWRLAVDRLPKRRSGTSRG